MSRFSALLFLGACTPISPGVPGSTSGSEASSSSEEASTQEIPTGSLSDGTSSTTDLGTSSSEASSSSGEPNTTSSTSGSTTSSTTSSTSSTSDTTSENSTGDPILECDPPSSKCGTPEQECNGTPGCLPECVWDTRLIFISSTSFTGNLGGIEGANQTCQDLAQGEGFCGTFKALLQWEEETMWKDHKKFLGRYLQTNGEILSEGVLLEDVKHGPFYGNNGKLQTGPVWSGFGNMDLGKTCQGPTNTPWTNDDPETEGWAGVAGGFQTIWFNFNPLACDQTARLHCVQVD